MKKIATGVLVLFLFSTALCTPQPERVIIVFTERPDLALLSSYGVSVREVFHIIPAVVATAPKSALERIQGNSQIRYIQPDSYVQYVTVPASGIQPTRQVIPWGVDRIDADRAWSQSTGKEVRIAVIDTGIDRDHPDLQENIHGGINTIAPSGGYPDPHNFDDDHGHGTFCAGIIAAVNNNIGVVGVAPGAWLYGVKVLDFSGSGYMSDIVEGIEWCVDNRMQVISMSFGGTDNQVLHDACVAAWENGIVLVASEGPCGEIVYPAAYTSVIAVAATDRNDHQGYEYGEELELVAPGEGIMSTVPGGGYAVLSGTSLGCPHVSGTAALVIAIHPEYTNDIIRWILQVTAEDLGSPGWDPYYGYGIVDAERAVNYGIV